MEAKKVRIGTRGSALALWQARHIALRLSEELGIASEIKIIKTKGDEILDAPLAKIGGKGLFTKELEESLLRGEIDIAVHSLKDVPLEFVPTLGLACITKREDARDCFLSYKYPSLQDLPPSACVGTTSLRRSMQLKALRGDLRTQSLRGNILTRLERLKNGDFDAIVLAKAGLNRLDTATEGVAFVRAFEIGEMLPAMGQGALGIEARLGDELFARLKALEDRETALCSSIERDFVRTLEGGCQVPIGVHARVVGESVRVEAMVGLPNGKKILRDSLESPQNGSEEMGILLARRMIEKGALEILKEAHEIAWQDL